MRRYLAIDIGASSGRHMIGWLEGGHIRTEEVYRFPNYVKKEEGELTWDIDYLEEQIRKGIDEALLKFSEIRSLSIDTWGVDYVLLKDGKPLIPCFSYRNGTDPEIQNMVHSLVPFEELYQRTGIQFQPFNTIYQLYRDMLSGKLDKATSFLMMPEYLLYRLCGVEAHEYTNATTSGMVNAKTCEYDKEILHRLGFPERLFHPLVKPGKSLGKYKGIDCILCATHDTASAVEGIPTGNGDLYLSSGTWSLLGTKVNHAITTKESRQANYSNEGGIGYIRYQKNIMGMWMVNELKKELAPEASFESLIRQAEESTFSPTVDANDNVFLAPESMKKALLSRLTVEPSSIGDWFRCVFQSLAESYQRAIAELEHNTGRTYYSLYIVGGGAKNGYLNRLVEEKSGKHVVALPIEATALGNLKVQLEVQG